MLSNKICTLQEVPSKHDHQILTEVRGYLEALDFADKSQLLDWWT